MTRSYDMGAQHRNISAAYDQEDPDGLRKFLEDLPKFRERRYKGDYAASDVLIDLQSAIDQAGLTLRQKQALHLIFNDNLTPNEGAEEMGVSRFGFDKNLNGGIKRIVAVYRRWNYVKIDGGD